jgi:hypothetical protein
VTARRSARLGPPRASWLTSALHAPAVPHLQAAEQLRPIWRGMHEQHSYPEFDAEWKKAGLIFSCASRLNLAPTATPPAPPALISAAPAPASGTAAAGSRTESPEPPHPLDAAAAAMLID